jgi:SAM-dependent methyltransferase
MDTPAGTLGSFVKTAAQSLATVPTQDLAAELLARVRGGESLGGHGGRSELFAVLAMELELRGDDYSNRFSRKHLACSLDFFQSALPGGLSWLPGKTVVEFGCGNVNPLGHLFASVLLGSARGIGIDLDTVQEIPTACRGLVRCAAYMLLDPRILVGGVAVEREQVAARVRGFDLVKLWEGDPRGVDESRLMLRRESAANTSFKDGEVDLVFSRSFLEHVEDLDAVAAELGRITSPGGYGLHTVDGFDHWYYSNPEHHPLAFLGESPGVRMVHGSNRLRPMEFPELFARHGFEVLRFDPHTRIPVDAARRASYVEPFRSLPQDVLEVASCGLVLRRRP